MTWPVSGAKLPGATWSVWVADAHTGEGREVWRNAPDDERFAEVRAIRWVGDRILFGKWSGTEVKLDGEDLMILKETDILGVVGQTTSKKHAA